MKLTNDDCDALDREIDLLSGDANLGEMAAEDTYGRILAPLLLQEGYELKQTPRSRDSGIDFYGERKTASDSLEPETCGIQVKYYRRSKIDFDQVRSMIGAAVLQNITRAILVSNSDFTRSAREAVASEMPLKVELFGLSDLRNWVARFRVETPDIEAEVRVILRDLSARLARMIALDKSTLAYLEWRDVERVVAGI